VTTIEVFADVRCPFAHVGLRRLFDERERRGSHVPVLIRAWPLELVNDAPLDPHLIAAEVDALRAQAAPDLFTGFDRRRFPASSLPALALTAEAYAIGVEPGTRIALALRWAFFEEGRDVSDPDVLLDVAASVGVDSLPVGHERVLADLREGRARGVTGSPHFFIEGAGFFCPALDISHDDGGFHVAADDAAFEAMVETAFGSQPLGG
jgi:predicted DsbA family dithiol-disulfide isomerase